MLTVGPTQFDNLSSIIVRRVTTNGFDEDLEFDEFGFGEFNTH